MNMICESSKAVFIWGIAQLSEAADKPHTVELNPLFDTLIYRVGGQVVGMETGGRYFLEQEEIATA